MLGQLEAAGNDFRRAIALDRIYNGLIEFPESRRPKGNRPLRTGPGLPPPGPERGGDRRVQPGDRAQPRRPERLCRPRRRLRRARPLDPALTDYNEAIRLDPNHSRAFASRGTCCHRQGEIDRGVDATSTRPPARSGLRPRPPAPRRLLSYLGQNEKALADYDALIQANPKDAGALKDRGGVLVRMGKYQRAIEDLDKAIPLDPRRASALLNRGAAHNGLRQYDRAIADLTRRSSSTAHHAGARHQSRPGPLRDSASMSRPSRT